MSKKMKQKKPVGLNEVIDLGKMIGSISLVPVVGEPLGFPEVDLIPQWVPTFDPTAYVMLEENPIFTFKMVLFQRELKKDCKFFKVHLCICFRRVGVMLWSEFDRDVVPPTVGAKQYLVECKRTIEEDLGGPSTLARLYSLMACRPDLFLEIPGNIEENILN